MKVRFSTILTRGFLFRLGLAHRSALRVGNFQIKKDNIKRKPLGQGKRRPENYHNVTSDHALSLFISAWETNPSSPVSDRRNESYNGKVFNRTREL